MKPPLVRIARPTFALAALCFLMPFVTLSCPGDSATFAGITVISGTEWNHFELPGQPLALWALLAAVVALFLGFAKARPAEVGSALAGAFGCLLLLFLRVKLDQDVIRRGEGVVHIDYRFGYWLAVLSLAAGSALTWYEGKYSRKREEPSTDDL